MRQKSQLTIVETKYRGVTIAEATDKNNRQTISAIIDNKLLLSETKNTLERAIDTYRGDPCLSENPQDRELFERSLNIDNELAKI